MKQRKNKHKNKSGKFKPDRNRKQKLIKKSRPDAPVVISFILYHDNGIAKVFDRPDKAIEAAELQSETSNNVSLWELTYSRKAERIFSYDGIKKECNEQFKQFLKKTEEIC